MTSSRNVSYEGTEEEREQAGYRVVRNTAVLVTAESEFGRAEKFVRRAVDVYRNTKRFYAPTPEMAILRLISHAERISALSPKVIDDRLRENAKGAVWAMIQDLQGMDARDTEVHHPVETPAGDAEQVLRTGAVAEAGLSQQAAASDWYLNPAMARARLPEESPVSFRDPAEQLARYKIRASERLKTVLPPRRDAQFQLIGDNRIMDRMRAYERRLGLDREGGREAPE